MLLIDKPTSCLNWQFIDKDKFPETFNSENVKEDFELLFQQHIDTTKLKELLRNTLRDPNQASRKFLWKRILLQDISQTQITIEKYNKKISVLFGKDLTLNAELPNIVSSNNLFFYYLNEEGRSAGCRVLNVLASAHPDITYAPLLLPLASLFLHYMTEPECYACLLSVVESKNKITQTDIHWTTSNLVFRRFAQKYSRSSYNYVIEALYRQTNNLETSLEVLDNWQWWIFQHLPFNFILNIVDSFLLEGQKVLYRFGICILEYFYKSFKSHDRPQKLQIDSIDKFCSKIMKKEQDLMIKSAFGLRNMRRKDIEIVFQAEEKTVKKIRDKTYVESSLSFSHGSDIDKYKADVTSRTEKMFCKQSSLKLKLRNKEKDKNFKSNSIKEAENNIISWQAAIKTISIGKKWRAKSNKALQSHLSYCHHMPQSQMNLPSFSLEDTGSKILTHHQIAQIWRWLPIRYQLLELQIIYSTSIHGCRLMTLFDKIEYYPATIIIIKTMTGAIFGAFCSEPWSNRINNSKFRRPAFFGNGETFLFELKPSVEKYEWIGIEENGNTNANQELFLYADNTKLVIGGGSTDNKESSTMSEVTSALMANRLQPSVRFTTDETSMELKPNFDQPRGMGLVIESDLIKGRSAACDTFENKVLGDNVSFEILALEVLSFNGGLEDCS